MDFARASSAGPGDRRAYSGSSERLGDGRCAVCNPACGCRRERTGSHRSWQSSTTTAAATACSVWASAWRASPPSAAAADDRPGWRSLPRSDSTQQDRLCLDGQRLRLTSGAYGQQGSQYQTEVETFSRVTAFGTAGSGPAWFQVERRDGLVYQYGATNDSRIESQGSTTPREWALNRIRDRSGNYMDFVYTEDAASGSYRPARVDYTGNATVGSAPYYSVRFTYAGRAAGDLAGGYVGGGLVQEGYRLARIDAQHVSGSVLRSYVLTYDTSGPSSRSRLARVQECAGSACFAPTNFTWALRRPGGSPMFRWVSMPRRSRPRSRATRTATGTRTSCISTRVRARGWRCTAALRDCRVHRSARVSDRTARRPRHCRGISTATGAVTSWCREPATSGNGCARGRARRIRTRRTGVTNVAAAGSTALVDVDGDGLDDFVYVKDPGTLDLVAPEPDGRRNSKLRGGGGALDRIAGNTHRCAALCHVIAALPFDGADRGLQR